MPPKKRAEKVSLKAQLAELRKQIREIQEKIQGEAAGEQKRRTHNAPAWVMIREHLQSVGGTDIDINIADSLVAAGHGLGKYPLRTVMNSVTSPRLNGMFTVERNEGGNTYVSISSSFKYRTNLSRYPAAAAKPSLVPRKPKSSK